jgi:hypothetical protein
MHFLALQVSCMAEPEKHRKVLINHTILISLYLKIIFIFEKNAEDIT